MSSFINITTGLNYQEHSHSLIRKRIRESLEKLKTNGNPIKSGDNVAIKVNIIAPLPPEKAACTHPEIVRAVIEELKSDGANVGIYEDCYSDTAADIAGITSIAKSLGVEFINLRDRPYREIEVNGRVYEFYEDILQATHLISIPKVKTHILTNYSGAIKLMYGSITKRQRVSYHRYSEIEDFSKVLVDIFSIKLPTMVIMDGILSMDGSGPTHGNPVESGLLLISDDAVAADYYTCKMMNYNPLQIDSIRIAMERKLVKGDFKDIEFIGKMPEDIKLKFNLIPILSGAMKKRYKKMVFGPVVFDFNESLCTGCRLCEASCPFNAISMNEYPIVDNEKCEHCLCCAELCPNGAFTPNFVFESRWGK